MRGHLSDGYSLLLLDLHGEAFHVGVFEVEAEVLSAQAHVGQRSGGLGAEKGGEITGHSHGEVEKVDIKVGRVLDGYKTG